MRKGFFVLCALLCSASGYAADMGHYGLETMSIDFAAPVVGLKTSLSDVPAGQIVFEQGTGFWGLSTTGGAGTAGNWVLMGSVIGGPRGQVACNTPNGYGSTNAYVRIWTNCTTTGTDVTYVTSGTLGDTFTVQTAGIYTMSLTYDNGPANSTTGITKNSTHLTVAVTAADLLALADVNNVSGGVTVTDILAIGDVIRVQTGGAKPTSTSANTMFRITKMSN